MSIVKLRNQGGTTPIPITGSVMITAPTFIGNNAKTVTVAGTMEPLSTTVYALYVIIVAKEGNAGTIWIGGENVPLDQGRPLKPLQAERIEIDDLSKVWVNGDVSGDGVTYTYGSYASYFLRDDDGNIVYDPNGNPVTA